MIWLHDIKSLNEPTKYTSKLKLFYKRLIYIAYNIHIFHFTKTCLIYSDCSKANRDSELILNKTNIIQFSQIYSDIQS